MPVQGAPVTPIDKSGNVIGSAGSPSVVTPLVTQTAEASVDGFTNSTIKQTDVANTKALIEVTSRIWNGTSYDRMPGSTAGQFTISKGGPSMATGQVAVTTSSTLVAAARAGRQKITLSPTSSVVYYVGNTGVTSATGVYVAAGGSITLETSAAIYAAGASNVTISYIEMF